MKSFIFLLSILALAFSQIIVDLNSDATRGCTIPEKEGKCCWMNNNGCCKPPAPNQMCTQAFRKCCKTKTYNEATGTYTYTYN